jgi:hypothetical protein
MSHAAPHVAAGRAGAGADMRRLRIALAFVLVAAITATAAGAPPEPGGARGREAVRLPEAAEHVRRLRPMTPLARRLLDDGAARSPTFRALADRVERSDVIVYIDVRPTLADALGGAMTFVAATATHRIVRITINGRFTWPTMVAVLGHELQHVVEVAEAARVRCSRSMRRHYEEIGIRLADHRYDSEAAQAAGRTVRAELRGGRSDMRLARAERETEERLLRGGSIGSEMMP